MVSVIISMSLIMYYFNIDNMMHPEIIVAAAIIWHSGNKHVTKIYNNPTNDNDEES